MPTAALMRFATSNRAAYTVDSALVRRARFWSEDNMEFRKVLALRGPNIWANFPVLEAWVDLGDLDKPSNEIPGFNERLVSWMPTMIEHRCSVGKRGGFFQRLSRGTYPGHILEHVTLELQSLAGVEVGLRPCPRNVRRVRLQSRRRVSSTRRWRARP